MRIDLELQAIDRIQFMTLAIPHVNILLTTFNGEEYLEEQLESLKGQVGVTISVYANDDGSSDQTVRILNKWSKIIDIKSMTVTNRIGASAGFFKLLSELHDTEFVAFCDQDDIWEPFKLIKQIKSINTTDATLVFSKRCYIDGKSKLIGESPRLKHSPSFANALIENIAYGNTILLNREGVALVQRTINFKVKHFDSWIYLVLSGAGNCIFLNESLTRYRIHHNNTVGLRDKSVQKFLLGINNYRIQAGQLNEKFAECLSVENKTELLKFLSIFETNKIIKRLIKILRYNFERQSRIDSAGIKLFLIASTFMDFKSSERQ